MGATSSKEHQGETKLRLNANNNNNIAAPQSARVKEPSGKNEFASAMSSKIHGQRDQLESKTRKGTNGTNSARQGSTGYNTATAPMQQPLQDDGGSSYVADDEVTVNLAMADLMAFLLVVANNSNNLPLTRRDDPEVGKSVSAFPPDEYARKSAAFVPADVRVIGGSFTKYGRVWDLPTSQEFTVADGAQEPGMFTSAISFHYSRLVVGLIHCLLYIFHRTGRSYGGACCNAMLKVLYDAANEVVDLTPDDLGARSNSLFDDDDDSTLGPSIALHRDRTHESLVLGDISTPSAITWAELLRNMKAEIQDIEYAQVPAITSSRKFDINKPFSLIPDNFDPSTGQKRSLLIGCNYHGVAGAELKASHDDIRSMKVRS